MGIGKIYNNVKQIGVDTNQKTAGDNGELIMNVILPPTIKVAPVGGLQNTYEVVGYVDISRFTTDKDNSLVKYFQSKDTKVRNSLEILETLRAMSFDGSKYKRYAETKATMTAFDRFTNFVQWGLPMCILILWVYMSTIFVMAFFPISRRWLLNIQNDTGTDVLRKLSMGFLDITDDVPEFKAYIMVSFTMFFIATLFNTIVADFMIAIAKALAAFWYTFK